MGRRLTIYSLALFIPITILSQWKVALTSQFSILTDAEAVNQAWSWWQFWIASVRAGSLPLWDPYTLAGHTFTGEMQTAAFYPVRLLFALIPPGPNYTLSPLVFHYWYVFTHILAACFMFALIRELGLSRFAGIVAGTCFSLGGFVVRMQWPHMLESSIWLPLIFLFLLRSLRAGALRPMVLNAAAGGLMLGMSVLAGGFHVVVMQALAIASACAFHAFSRGKARTTPLRRPWVAAAAACVIVGVVGAAAGAVQLLPSMEYSPLALRYLGAPGSLAGDQRIPYAYLTDGLYPKAFLALLIPYGLHGSGEVANPYIGVFPLILAVIGVWKAWGNRWVRFLTGLGIAAFLYALGSFSPLHGVLYALVPWLWMAREASRIVYLLDFSLAILAAFGVEFLFSKRSVLADWRVPIRCLAGLSIVCAAILFCSAVFGRPEISPWIQFSFLLIFLSAALFRHVARGNSGTWVRALAVGLIVFDLSAFDWAARNKRQNPVFLDRLLSCRRAVEFLKSRPGVFRVEVTGEPKPNIGDVYGVQTVTPAGVTIPIAYEKIMGRSGLLNVRYRLAPASTGESGAVYQDSDWKVYENPNGLPRAWLVHETVREPDLDRCATLLGNADFDPRRTAVTETRVAVEPPAAPADEPVRVSGWQANRIEMQVRAQTRALLVVSETYYPGWKATINGKPVDILRADGALRGVLVPPGESRVVMSYAPLTVYSGGAVTLAAFAIVGAGLSVFRRELRSGAADEDEAPAEVGNMTSQGRP